MSISLEEIEKRAIAGQKRLLADMLKRGIPLVYKDKHGRMVKEHPDGHIEVMREPHAENAHDLRA